MTSKIFDSYAKAMQDKTLVKKADHAEHTEKNTHKPRWDSLSIEQIGKLYDTKADRPEDMDYKNNIMEDAHPDSVVISPSYDKLNGLIENEIEGQAIRARIVMKQPDGHLTNRKYAENQLVLSLVRVANDLDNRNHEELRKLADYCLLQATEPKKKIVKKAIAPLLVIIPISIILGLIALKNNSKFHHDGFEMDLQKVQAEINDIVTSNTNFGFGKSYRPEFITLVNDLSAKLQRFKDLYLPLSKIIDQLEAPRTGAEITDMAQRPEFKNITEQTKKIIDELVNLTPYLVKNIRNFSNESYQARQVADKGMFTQMLEAIPGSSSLVSTDIKDVARGLETLLEDITDITTSLNNANSIIEQSKKDLSESKQTFTQQPKKETIVPSQISQTTTNDEEETSKLEEELKGFGL